MARASRDQHHLRLSRAVESAVREALPRVAEQVVAAVVAEVPSYSRAFAGPMGETIRRAVTVALGGFLTRIGRLGEASGPPRTPALGGAYDLGRGEARAGRSMDALLGAYRVGARVAWRGISEAAVAAGLPADRLVVFAELVFAYIDELSAASVAGHADELESTGRVRQRLLGRVAQLLVAEAPADAVVAAAERADWEPPQTLTAVLLPPSQVRGALTALGGPAARTLAADEDVAGVEDANLLLVPDASPASLRRVLHGRHALVGPPRPWLRAVESYRRVVRARALELPSRAEPLVTEDHLVPLVLQADPAARSDLRARVLAPLDGVRDSQRPKLEDTLRAWLLCQGRREQVAGLLFVHPQTVRYRMGQLRELFGDRLDDPEAVLELIVALG